LQKVGRLQDTLGANPYEIADKQRLKREVDAELFPFHVLAMTWSGGVMLGKGRCDDQGYAELLQHVAQHGELPERLDESLIHMLETGSGLPGLPAHREGIQAALEHQVEEGESKARALAYDLTFPEVFYPTAVVYDRKGFHAVLGNPPWDAVRPKAKEFFANYDFDILAAPTKRERTAIENKLKADPLIAALHEEYIESIAQQNRSNDRLFEYQVAEVNGEKTGGDPDLVKLFLERCAGLLRRDGRVGLVAPSAFHANEGATGVRRLYLEKLGLRACYSFENHRKIFDIHSSFKFATVVAQAGATTDRVSCAFYLHDDEWLFGESDGRKPLNYSLDFIRRTGGEYLSLLELRSVTDLKIAEVCFADGEPFGRVCERLGIRLGRELHMTDDAWRFTPTSQVLTNGQDPRDRDIAVELLDAGYLLLHEGKTFWQFAERAETAVRYLVSVAILRDKPSLLLASRYFRLAYRQVQNAGNQRTVIFTLMEPGGTSGHSVAAEHTPANRSNGDGLSICAIANSFPFDFLMRVRSTANVTKFLMDASPLARCTGGPSSSLLAHSALRLTCNHSGYAALWREQLGDAWREPKPPFTWPVLATDDERWEVRAAIDAVVADAYGLSRDQYAHVLSTFSHKSYPKAPALCLAKFDELKQTGLEAFTRKYDPYWDLPLNESLPQPVIELPTVAEPHGERFTLSEPAAKRRGKGRAKRGGT
jgi:hypothetical protein